MAVATASCRDCDTPSVGPAEAGPVATTSGPRMPVGMLSPAGSSAGADTDAGERPSLGLAKGQKSGSWVELQIAGASDDASKKTFEHWKDDSRFLSVDALTQLHGVFARAMPGFDLFLPRLFAGEALAKLVKELEAFADDAKNGATMRSTARDAATFAKEVSGKGRGLWVLGG